MYVVVDALDECQREDGNYEEEIFEALCRLQTETGRAFVGPRCVDPGILSGSDPLRHSSDWKQGTDRLPPQPPVTPAVPFSADVGCLSDQTAPGLLTRGNSSLSTDGDAESGDPWHLGADSSGVDVESAFERLFDGIASQSPGGSNEVDWLTLAFACASFRVLALRDGPMPCPEQRRAVRQSSLVNHRSITIHMSIMVTWCVVKCVFDLGLFVLLVCLSAPGKDRYSSDEEGNDARILFARDMRSKGLATVGWWW